VELVMYDLKKLPDDIPRSEAMLGRYLRDKTTSADQYLDLGNKMDKLQRSNIYNNQQVEKLITLRNQCWTTALEMREATTAPDDANAFFLLSQQWDDLLHKTNKRRDLLRKALQIDPDHPGASKVARDLGLVKDKKTGRWITRDEYERMVAEENERKKKSELLDEQAKIARAKVREKAIAERPRELARFQSALKTDDLKAQDGALESLSEATQNSLDPVFARQGVQILAQSPSLGAAVKGLGMALKNEAPEVRQDAFEALIWRGGPEAFKTIQTGLLAESNVDTARAAIGALVSRADKEAAGVLVESLESPQPAVVMDAVAALKAITGVNQPGKDAWVKWWKENKDKPDLKLSAPE
jgi:HEAT repeat protein